MLFRPPTHWTDESILFKRMSNNIKLLSKQTVTLHQLKKKSSSFSDIISCIKVYSSFESMKLFYAFILALVHLGAVPCNCQDVRKRNASRRLLLGKGKTGHPSSYPTQEPSTPLKKKNKKKNDSSVPSISTSSPSITLTLEPSVFPTMKSNSPSRTISRVPSVSPTMKSNSPSRTISRVPSYHPSFKKSTVKPSILHSPNPSVGPTVGSSTPTLAPVSRSANPTEHKETQLVSSSPSSSGTSQISPKPTLEVTTSFPSSTPVESNNPYTSYIPSTNNNLDLCKIRNMTIGNTIGNSVIIKYTYEMTHNSTSNIFDLMSNVQESVMNGLLPIVDSCEGVILTSNTIVGISGEPDDTILPDPCASPDDDEVYPCTRIEARMTFFFTDTESFDTLDILDRIKTILDSKSVEGRDKDIILLQYVTNELIGSGPMSETDDDTLQQKSAEKVPIYAWLLIALGGFAALGIVGNRLQRNLKKYREVDSIISDHAIE